MLIPSIVGCCPPLAIIPMCHAIVSSHDALPLKKCDHSPLLPYPILLLKNRPEYKSRQDVATEELRPAILTTGWKTYFYTPAICMFYAFVFSLVTCKLSFELFYIFLLLKKFTTSPEYLHIFFILAFTIELNGPMYVIEVLYSNAWDGRQNDTVINVSLCVINTVCIK